MRVLPTLRQLTYLVAVADHRHFGRAADDCLVAQSTLSAGLRELEDLLGVTLVGRGKREATLTAVGEDIVERARTLLRAADELVDAARAGDRPLSGLLRLGVIPTVAPYLLPRVLPMLRRAYPDLRLYLREEQTARLLELLRRGRLDGALIALPYATDGLDEMRLADDPLLVACPKDHRFAQSGGIDAAALSGEKLLLLEDGHCLRNHALTACSLLPGQANEDLQATSLSTLVQMVAGGLGLTLVPRLAAEIETRREPALALVPFRDRTPARTIALVWPSLSVRAADLRLLGDVVHTHLANMPVPETEG
jgi:LysR family hydrogen peroxide-inducible transcriptional activator